MLVTRFGAEYGSAYLLPLVKGDQRESKLTTPVITPVSGADGEYDFFGEAAFPIPGKPIVIKGVLLSTYGGIDNLVDELVLKTLAQGCTKLWAESRDSATAVPIRWAWAKCISIPELQEIAGKNFTSYPITMNFLAVEGIWYSEGQQGHVLYESQHSTAYNLGTYANAPVSFLTTSPDVPIVYVRFRRVLGELTPVGGPPDYWLWSLDGNTLIWNDSGGNGSPIANGALTLDSDQMTAIISDPPNPDVNAYAGVDGNPLVTLGAGQVSWMVMGLRNAPDPVSGEGSYLEVVLFAGGNVDAVADTTPIEITTEADHGMATDDRVLIAGTGVTDGSFVITLTGAKTFTLNGTTAAGTATTGRWFRGGGITAVSTSGSPVTVTTSVAHGMSNSDNVCILGVSDDLDGVWVVGNVTATTFELQDDVSGSLYPARNVTTYVSGGRWGPNTLSTTVLSWYHTFR